MIGAVTPSRDVRLPRDVSKHVEFERPDLQVRAFWSNVHEGFYVVTIFGFPSFIYVKRLDRWFSAANDMASPTTWGLCYPHDNKVMHITPAMLSDIYRRGVAGLVKHRILGILK